LYNEVRPHSSLGYLTPAAFAAKLKNDAAPASATGQDAALNGGFAPRPVATPSLKGQLSEQETPVLSTKPWSEESGQVTPGATVPRIMREIRRRTRVVGAFPDGNSAINLAGARLRHIAGTRWSTKRYLDAELLKQRNAMIA
jgi:hypothetical protein